MQKIRVGLGYDVHALKEGETLFIGGIEIPHTLGTVAHSDGDILIHALCDALLGALSLRDIGFHFPDTDNEFKAIDSKILLKKTYQLILDRGYTLSNCDSTITAQKPKLSPYINSMREKIAEILQTDIMDVSIKATTSEKLGFEGREEGISVQSIVLLTKV